MLLGSTVLSNVRVSALSQPTNLQQPDLFTLLTDKKKKNVNEEPGKSQADSL